MTAPLRPTLIAHATYLGGLSGAPKSHTGNLVFEVDRFGIGSMHPKRMWVVCSQVASIDVYGAEVAKSKLGPAIAFGVLGAVAAKGRKDQTILVAHTRNGEAGYFLIDKARDIQVRAQIAPWMRAVNVGFREDVAQPQSAAVSTLGVADQLKQLADLKAAGALTEAEFSAAKAKLLGQT